MRAKSGRSALLLSLCILAAACGGGGGSDANSGIPLPATGSAAPSAPTVQKLEPPNLASAVPLDAAISVTFDQAIDPQSVTKLTMHVDDQNGFAVRGTFDVNGNTVIFTPAAPLKDGARYQASLGSGVKGTNGVGITVFLWAFNTIDLPPRLVATSPSAGGQIIPSGIITVSFNEAIDVASVTNTSFIVTGPGGAVSGSVSADGKQASFKPANRLQEGSSYSVALTSDITDLAGNHYGSGTFSFTAMTPAAPVDAYVTDQENKISAWGLSSASPPLNAVGELNTGLSPRKLLVTHSKRFVYVLNETSNDISAYSISADGSLSEINGSPFSAGKYPFRIATTPDDHYLFVLNLASANLSVFALDPDTGGLAESDGSPYTVGLSPGSVLVDPSGDYLYVSNADVGLQPYKIDRASGDLTPGINNDFYTGGAPLDLVMHPNGHFVYGANNFLLHVFYVDPETHAVSRVATTTQPIGQPLDPVMFLAVDPSGRALYTYNESDFGVCFAINPDNGQLTPASAKFGQYKNLADLVFTPDGMLAYATTWLAGYLNYPNDPVGGVIKYTVDAENCTLQQSGSVNANFAVRNIVLR